MFGFDKQFAMFDVTPVENQYILELLPAAKGDYVKVYLYGLMYCYHPEESLSVDQIAHDLNMTAEDVLASQPFALEAAAAAGLPLKMTCAAETICPALEGRVDDLFPLTLQRLYYMLNQNANI